MYLLKLSKIPENVLSCWTQNNARDIFRTIPTNKKNEKLIKEKRLAGQIQQD